MRHIGPPSKSLLLAGLLLLALAVRPALARTVPHSAKTAHAQATSPRRKTTAGKSKTASGKSKKTSGKSKPAASKRASSGKTAATQRKSTSAKLSPGSPRVTSSGKPAATTAVATSILPAESGVAVPTPPVAAKPLIGPTRGPAHADTLSPVGHWVEKGNNNNELQLWWDFNPDGTLTVTAGATARTRWKLDGDTLTVGVATPQQPAGVFNVRFQKGRLYSTPRVQNPPTLEYTRIGEQRYDSAPLVGRWQISNAPHAADPHEEEVRNRMVKAVTEYNPDGSYEVRAPIDATAGTWDAATHTYTLKGYAAMPFERKGTTLILTSPVGPKGQRTYVPDGFF